MKSNNQDFNSIFEKCACSAHTLEIQKYCYETEYDEGFYISIWHLGRGSNNMCWRERLRWVWRIICTGNPWADSVILSNKQAKKLADYINKHLPKE